MRTLHESIIGKRSNFILGTIIPIPGTLRFYYENDTWDGKDHCDCWYLIIDQSQDRLILWSPKSDYYPYSYRNYFDHKWTFILDNEWELIEKNTSVKTPGDMLSIINDPDAWSDFVNIPIQNVEIKMPDSVQKLLKSKLGL